jgi:hypothetical protein
MPTLLLLAIIYAVLWLAGVGLGLHHPLGYALWVISLIIIIVYVVQGWRPWPREPRS